MQKEKGPPATTGGKHSEDSGKTKQTHVHQGQAVKHQCAASTERREGDAMAGRLSIRKLQRFFATVHQGARGMKPVAWQRAATV